MNPELLAPAGEIESVYAALHYGADAVYLGLDDFNARLRAKNFSIKTLTYLLPYAHTRNVKIYVTLNTLIKQAEIEPLVHTLYQLEQLQRNRRAQKVVLLAVESPLNLLPCRSFRIPSSLLQPGKRSQPLPRMLHKPLSHLLCQ